MPRQQRPSAEPTRNKILNAAKKLFLHHGYSGASMQKIADDANVNQNLIFHHFQNKSNLWRSVKSMIATTCQDIPEYNVDSAQTFLQDIIAYRFSVYADNPDLIQLMRWQQLETTDDDIIGINTTSPQSWKKWLKHFQQQGDIRADIEVDILTIFIATSISGIFMQNAIPINNKKIQAYQQLVTENMLSYKFI